MIEEAALQISENIKKMREQSRQAAENKGAASEGQGSGAGSKGFPPGRDVAEASETVGAPLVGACLKPDEVTSDPAAGANQPAEGLQTP